MRRREEGGRTRQSTCADALLIQPVVLSRDTVMPIMGIESSGAVGGGRGWWYGQSCSVPSAVVGAGWRGEMGPLGAGRAMPRECPDTRVVWAHVRLGWGVGVIEAEALVHDEST